MEKRLTDKQREFLRMTLEGEGFWTIHRASQRYLIRFLQRNPETYHDKMAVFLNSVANRWKKFKQI